MEAVLIGVTPHSWRWGSGTEGVSDHTALAVWSPVGACAQCRDVVSLGAVVQSENGLGNGQL